MMLLLVNIIYNDLAQDHPGVLKEQRASYDDGSCPGNVFHPYYIPTWLLNISACSEPSFIPPLLHVLVWQLLERLPRIKNI